MTLYFQKFCDENNLLFYMCGGGCIGAIRHKGFIPWDDDIDVFMPRDDYEKLKVLWRQKADNDKYPCIYSDKNLVDGNLFITIRDTDTTFIKPYQQKLDIPHGLVLDILPIDGYPDKPFQRKLQVFWALIYSLYCAQQIPQNHGTLKKVIGAVALGIVPFKGLRYRIWKFAEKQMTKYKISDCNHITELCSGPGYMKKKYNKEAFESALLMDFEGYKLPVPVGYDHYLKTAFGDYMKMPPKEKQKPHHEALFIDLDNSYLKYKGKYYLTEENK
ncbi:MAG: LicD family protein [Clostridia bacterium]|nr:LicD family protein [Clostridia bacterium]